MQGSAIFVARKCPRQARIDVCWNRYHVQAARRNRMGIHAFEMAFKTHGDQQLCPCPSGERKGLVQATTAQCLYVLILESESQIVSCYVSICPEAVKVGVGSIDKRFK